jgi:hypothetical protein
METPARLLQLVGWQRFDHFCPACKERHTLVSSITPDFASPDFYTTTFSFLDLDFFTYRCEYRIREGKIEFSDNCTHEFSGRTIPLEDMNYLCIISPDEVREYIASKGFNLPPVDIAAHELGAPQKRYVFSPIEGDIDWSEFKV